MLAVIDAVLLTAAGLVVLLTLLPLWGAKYWWVRIWDFPRQQLAALGAGTALGLILVEGIPMPGYDMAVPLLLVGATLYQLAFITPYTPLWRRSGLAVKNGEAGGPRSLCLVVANVLMTNRRADGLLRSLRETRPDIVLALETDQWWCDRLAEALHDYPHRVLHPLDNTYGMLLFSRLELVEPELRFLLKPDIPSIRTRVRLRSGEEVTLHCIHPEPPAPQEAETSLPRDAELVMVGREIAREPGATLVAGDLNDVAWSHTSRLFRRLSGLIDPRVGRGFFNSFHADWPLLRWPLDHVFYGQEFLLRKLERLPAYGSDHFPILIALDHAPRAAAHQEVEAPEPEDHEEARETVAEALEEQREEAAEEAAEAAEGAPGKAPAGTAPAGAAA